MVDAWLFNTHCIDMPSTKYWPSTTS